MKRIIPCVLVSLALVLAGFFLPVLGFFCLMLCPLPLCVLGCVEGQKQMAIAELMIEITIFIVISPSMAVYFIVGCAPIAGIVYAVSREDIKRVKKFSGPDSFLLCAGVSIVFKIILLAGFYFFTSRNIFIPDVSQMSATLDQIYGGDPDLQESVMQIVGLLPYLLPTMLVLYSVVESFLNYSLCGKFVKKISPTSQSFPPELPEFKTWRFSPSLLLVLVCSFVASYFVKTDTWFDGAVYLMNLQLVINAFMFVHGLAFAFWIMDGFKMKRGAKIFTCAVLAIPFFWAWLIVMGMSDMALNLRERIKFKSR